MEIDSFWNNSYNIVREVVLYSEYQPNKAPQGKGCYKAAVSSLHQPMIKPNWVIYIRRHLQSKASVSEAFATLSFSFTAVIYKRMEHKLCI